MGLSNDENFVDREGSSEMTLVDPLCAKNKGKTIALYSSKRNRTLSRETRLHLVGGMKESNRGRDSG